MEAMHEVCCIEKAIESGTLLMLEEPRNVRDVHAVPRCETAAMQQRWRSAKLLQVGHSRVRSYLGRFS